MCVHVCVRTYVCVCVCVHVCSYTYIIQYVHTYACICRMDSIHLNHFIVHMYRIFDVRM